MIRVRHFFNHHTQVRLKEKFVASLPAFLLLCFLAGWSCYYFDIFYSQTKLLPRDNAKHHLPLFLYIVRYLRDFGTFPEWLHSPKGGVWFAPLSNNFMLIAPYRWPGYWLGASGWVGELLAYKISLLFGAGIFLYGVFLASGIFLKQRWQQCFLVALAAITSTGSTFFYQEQALGTLLYVPYLWWSLSKIQTHKRYFWLFASFAGLSLNNHYPQILFIYAICLAVVMAGLFRREVVAFFLAYLKGKDLAIAGVCFLVSASPVIYSYIQYGKKLQSPLRAQRDSIKALSYEEYDKINRYVPSSLDPRNLPLYGNFQDAPRFDVSYLDETALFSTEAVWAAILILLLWPSSVGNFFLLSLVFLALSSFGIHTPWPRLFWGWLPGIELFRQWYHFTSLLSLHLIATIAWVLSEKPWLSRRGFFGRWLVLTLALLILSYQGWLTYLGALFPPLLLLASFLASQRTQALRVSAAAYCLVFLSAVAGGSFIYSLMQTYLNESRAVYYVSNPVWEKELSQWEKLRSTYLEQVILPVGVNSEQMQLLSEGTGVFVSGVERRITSLDRRKIAVRDGAFEFSPPANASVLYLNEFNDGEWIATTDIGSPKIHPGPALAIQLPQGTRTVRLERRPISWGWLVFAMWLPGLTVLALPLWKSSSIRSRYFATPLSSPA